MGHTFTYTTMINVQFVMFINFVSYQTISVLFCHVMCYITKFKKKIDVTIDYLHLVHSIMFVHFTKLIRRSLNRFTKSRLTCNALSVLFDRQLADCKIRADVVDLCNHRNALNLREGDYVF